MGRAAWGGTSAAGSLEGASRVTRSLPTGLGRALHEGRGTTARGSSALPVGGTFVQCAQPLASRSPPSWNGPPQKRNMPEPTSSVRRQQPDGEPRMSASVTKAWIVLVLTTQNRMIPKFSFTRFEVRRSHCHRWGHQHADSPKSPVQQTYQAPSVSAPPSSSWALPGCSPRWSKRSGKHRGSWPHAALI